MGATRNFESWRMKDRIGTVDDELAAEKAKEEEEANPMAALEARTKESRQEMDILDALEEIKDANARAAKVDINEVLETKARAAEEERLKTEEEIKAEEDAAVAAAFARSLDGKKVSLLVVLEAADADDLSSFFVQLCPSAPTQVRRLSDEEPPETEASAASSADGGASFAGSAEQPLKKAKIGGPAAAPAAAAESAPSVGVIKANRASLVVRKPAGSAKPVAAAAAASTNGSAAAAGPQAAAAATATATASASSLAGLGGYGSSDED